MNATDSLTGGAELPIDAVALHHCRIGFKVKYATDELTEADSLIVEIRSGDLTGWGEVFMPRWQPLWAWALRVAPMLIGKDACLLDALLDAWPNDRPKLAKEDCCTYCHPDVDCVAESFSIALHDIVARARNCRFADLLGEVKRTEIPGMPVITIDELDVMATTAMEWAERGVRFLKLKLTGISEDDLAILNAVTSRLPSGVDIQVDANGSYGGLAAAERVMARVDEVGVSVVEDLFDVGDVDSCRAARSRLEAKYMVDKDAHWPHAKTILEQDAADLINQHPHNQGRMTYAMMISDATHEAGVENAIGSSGVLGIQNTAFLHLAAVTGLTRPCEDIGMHNSFNGPAGARAQFDRMPTVLADPTPMDDGSLLLPDGPGLGVTVDFDRLASLTQQSQLFV